MKRLLLSLALLSVLRSAVAGNVSAFSRVAVSEGAIVAQPAGETLFADDFSRTTNWTVENYQNRLAVTFGPNGLTVCGDHTSKWDTAWHVTTAKLPLTGKGSRYTLSFEIDSVPSLYDNSIELPIWQNRIRWFSADGSELPPTHLGFETAPNDRREVRLSGAIPAAAATFMLQLGFDVPNLYGTPAPCVVYRNLSFGIVPERPSVERIGSFVSLVRRCGRIGWQASTPPGTSVGFQVRTASSLSDLSRVAFAGPDGTDKTHYRRPFTPKGTWCQYKAYLFSDGKASARLSSVTVGNRLDRNWDLRPDVAPPHVRLTSPSPTLDRSVRPTLFVSDDSPIDWKTLEIVLDGASATDRFARSARRGGTLEWKGEAPCWTPGMHKLDVTLADSLGNAFTSKKRFYIGEPPSVPSVTIREDGTMLVGGKPFFPIGLYGVMRREFNEYDFDKAMRDLKAGGFNFAHSYGEARDPEFLAAAKKYGFLVFSPMGYPDDFLLKAHRDDPTIAAWCTGDDTSWHQKPWELRDKDEAIRAVDPKRLTTQADGVCQTAAVNAYYDYVEGTDTFQPEVYPIKFDNAEDRRLSVARAVRDMKLIREDIVRRGGKRPRGVWPIVQYFHGWGTQRFPTLAELRAMTFAVLAGGGKGITWYAYNGRVRPEKNQYNYGVTSTPERWKNICTLATQLKELSPVLLEGPTAQPAPPEILKGPAVNPLGDASVVFLLKRQGGGQWLIAVNSSPEPVTARFALADCHVAEVLWEKRTLPVANGRMTVYFEPFGSHVYRLR